MDDASLKILLIEDSPADADLVRYMLSESRQPSFTVEHVERLRDGLSILSKPGNDTDVVLLDFNLPDSTGLDSFKETHNAAPNVPVIILTNNKDEDTALLAVREGAQDYLVKKDVDSNLLTRSIRYAIERERAEKALRDSEERYALAACGANDGIWDWDMQAKKAYFSPRWKRILGLEDSDVGEDIEAWFRLVHPDDKPDFHAVLEAHLDGESEHFRHEYRMRRKSGEYCWVLSRGLAVRTAAGKPCRMAGSLSDITARKQAERQLLHDALHDSLTGLPNRTLLIDRVSQTLARAKRDKKLSFAVLYFDLDRFKNVNDYFGHDVGDDLLIQISGRVRECLRPWDTLARLGGDEFVILLQDDIHDATDVTHVADRLQKLLMEKFVVGGHEMYTSASIGVAFGPGSYEQPEEILRDADIAMYRAKKGGKARYEIFNAEMHRNVIALLRLENDLREAIAKEQFLMHYQPIVELRSGRIVGLEALLRWNHPKKGLIMPSNFITVAEESGLIVPIGWWVLKESCHQIKAWQRLFPSDPPLSVSVNVSGKILMQPDMLDRISGLIEEAQLEPSSLRLEITENIVVNHAEGALTVLAELRALGVQLHIDDFGTGYSSLSYLQSFRYDTLKIDRSFVGSLGQEDGSAIVKTIVGLANLLRINVIAEGVETIEQFDQLLEIDCPQAQGFWFARPMGTVMAEELLSRKYDC